MAINLSWWPDRDFLWTTDAWATDHRNIYKFLVMTRPRSSINYVALSSDRSVSRLFVQSSHNPKLVTTPNVRFNYSTIHITHDYTQPTTPCTLPCTKRACHTLMTCETNHWKSLKNANITRHRRLKSGWTNRITKVNRDRNVDKLHQYPTSSATTMLFKLFDQPTSHVTAMSWKIFNQPASSATAMCFTLFDQPTSLPTWVVV